MFFLAGIFGSFLGERMKFLLFLYIFITKVSLATNIDFSTIDISGDSIQVPQSLLSELKITWRDKTVHNGTWVAPLSPEALAKKINAQLQDSGLKAHYSSTVSKPSKKDLKKMLEKAFFIWVYRYSEHENKITIIKEPVPRSSLNKYLKTLEQNIDSSIFIASIQNLKPTHPREISKSRPFWNLLQERIDNFPEPEYFENWNSYSFVYVK